MKFNDFLNEAILDINNKDIDLLWNPLRKTITKLKKAIDKNDFKTLRRMFKNIISSYKEVDIRGDKIFSVQKLSSKDLKSPLAQIAHKINPLTIYTGFPLTSASYDPHTSTLYVGLPLSILVHLKRKKNIEDMRDDEILHFMTNLLSYYEIRTVMRHELTHWLDDTFRSRHIRTKSQKGTLRNVSSSSTEIEAIVHQIHQLKKDLKSTKHLVDPHEVIPWNKMDFHDLSAMIPGIKLTMNDIEFKKALLKRMFREKLLTPKMLKSLKN